MDKFKDKYRIASARAQFWDYSWNAAYFITICTQHRTCWFGDVVSGMMELSSIGHIAHSCWQAIPDHFPFVTLGPFVIMPNHVHGIIYINKTENRKTGNDGNMGNYGGNVETQDFASLQSQSQTSTLFSSALNPGISSKRGKSKNKFGPQSKNLASIIRGYKIGVTKNTRPQNPEFSWQSRYYDHIIRDEQSFQRIAEYITQNPSNWQHDMFYSP